jgi:hypothetical protein
LGYIFEFAEYGTLDTKMTMNHIVHVIEEAKAGCTKGEEIVKKVGLEKKLSLPLRSSLATTRIFMHSRIQQ